MEGVWKVLDGGKEEEGGERGGWVTALVEKDRTDSSFLVACLVGRCLRSSDQHVTLALTHGTLGHQHHVGRLLGYDLLATMQAHAHAHPREQAAPRVVVHELLKRVAGNVDGAIDPSETARDFVRSAIESARDMASRAPTTLLVDDLSHLLDLGAPFADVAMCVRALLALGRTDGVRLVLGCRSADGATNESDDARLAALLSRAADVRVSVSALRMGISRNVTGRMDVYRRDESTSSSNADNSWSSSWHYKLEHKAVEVFVPGSRDL